MADLNGARDWDVLMGETLPRLIGVLDTPPLGKGLQHLLGQEAESARKTAQATIASPAFTRLVLEIGRDLLSPPACSDPLQPWAAACLDDRWQRVLKRGKGYAHLDMAQRHRLRITAKHLRYTADVLCSAFAGSDRFIAHLGKLQDRLGSLQDNVVASHLVAGLRSPSRAVMFDAGRITGLLAGEREGHGQGGGKAWQALARARPFWRIKSKRH
jgi:CHAD domain-containing protein